MSSLNDISINDTDSNIDLNALESDPESYYSSEISSAASNNSSQQHSNGQLPLPQFVPTHQNDKIKATNFISDDDIKNPSIRNVSKNYYPDTLESPSITDFNASDKFEIKNTDNITNTITNTVTNTITNTITNTDTYSADDFDEFNENKEFNDSYSYDYTNNLKSKPGDKLKTSWTNAAQNERRYRDLQIINEVSKLQKLNFFSPDYTKNLETLKISQLKLLRDMVKLSENSFDEFFKIWDNIDTHEKQEDVFVSDIQSVPLMGSPSMIQTNVSVFTSDMEDKETRRMNSVFDINNNEGFKLMEERKNDILEGLEKINESIDQIDSFTKSMWSSI